MQSFVQSIHKDICEVGRLLFTKGLVAANDGNISVRISDDEIWTTPTGVSKGYLTPKKLVRVNRKGEVLEGNEAPSSELKMHLKVYEERADIHAVVHAHPPYATAFAIAGIPLDKAMMPETVVYLGTVPVAPYATPSTNEVPDSIAAYLHKHQALLLEHHGALSWSTDVFSAYFQMERLELTAKIQFLVQQMGKERELSKEKVAPLLKIREQLGYTGVTPLGK